MYILYHICYYLVSFINDLNIQIVLADQTTIFLYLFNSKTLFIENFKCILLLRRKYLNNLEFIEKNTYM